MTASTSPAPDRKMERIGFCGLGIIGLPVARNALAAGSALAVCDRTEGNLALIKVIERLSGREARASA